MCLKAPLQRTVVSIEIDLQNIAHKKKASMVPALIFLTPEDYITE